MNIGIEAQRLFRQNKHGMEIVLLETIKQMQLLQSNIKFIILTKTDIDQDCISKSSNFEIIETKQYSYPIWEQIILPRLSSKVKLDLLHCTSNTAPILCKTPLVITIHDLIYLEQYDFKGSLYQIFGNLYRRYVVPLVVKKAKVIIAASEYTKNQIIEKLNIREDKIKVVHNGLSEIYCEITDITVINLFRSKYNLPKSFLLHFSNTAPRKNTIGTLKAYAQYCMTNETSIPLVLTNCSKKTLLKLLNQLNKIELYNNILCLDYIPAKELPILYNAAKILLYPSFSEGFGMPVIESMACGTPVITSNSSSLPEIAGDSAILIDPNNPITISNAISELLSNMELYNNKKVQGLINAKRFNWKNSANKIISIYNEICK